ncbi:MAG: GNAT family N-acetyltransferase [Chloroflexota bacterium]
MRAALTPLTITPYQRRYLHPVRELLFQSQSVHTHLDWHETDQWLDTQQVPMRLAWQNGRLIGLIATSIPLHETCWIRLAAVQDFIDQGAVMRALWNDITTDLRAQNVRLVALLAVHDWIEDYALELGFKYQEDIITLARAGQLLPDPRRNTLTIRPTEPYDLETLTRVDQAAFSAPWQLAQDELRQAYRISASCTVALLDGRIVGYQLSTLYFDGAHLARLAVAPQLQGTGIGGALLGDALRRFFRRGVYSMTLNTQASNLQSQRLYRGFGFRPNGYDLPYWSVSL